MTTRPADTTIAQPIPGQRGIPLDAVARRLWRFARRRPLGAICGVLTVVAYAIAIGAWLDVIVPYDPIEFRGSDRLLPAFSESVRGDRFYVLGTDELGRDMLSRLLKGAQLSLFFGTGVAVISVIIGGAVGLFSAYAGGKVDLVVQRVVDAVQTVPLIVLALAIVAVTGPGIWQAFWVLAFLSITRPARVIRGSALSAKEDLYVEAARSLGATNLRLMFRHILPNVVAPMIVIATYTLGVAIIVEASLSFLGVSAQPPTPSWGAMLTGNGATYFTTNPQLALFPGIAIWLVVFATNMFGDAVRDELDPRLRGS